MVLAVLLGILLAGMLVFHVGLIDVKFSDINRLLSSIDLYILSLGMSHLGIKVIDGGLHVHLEVHVVSSDFVSIDCPRLARFLIRIRLFLLGLIAHLGFAALECSVAHIDLVVVQVNLSLVDFSIVHIHVQIH